MATTTQDSAWRTAVQWEVVEHLSDLPLTDAERRYVDTILSGDVESLRHFADIITKARRAGR